MWDETKRGKVKIDDGSFADWVKNSIKEREIFTDMHDISPKWSSPHVKKSELENFWKFGDQLKK